MKLKILAKWTGLSLLVLFSLTLIFSPLLTQLFVAWRTNQSRNFEADLAGNFNRWIDVDFPADLDIQPPQLVETLTTNVDKGMIIANIRVNSVGIDLPVFKGVEHLMSGAGTVIPRRQPGLNNFVVAGHNMLNRNLLFAPLQRVQIGDTVEIDNGHNVYKFAVDNIFRVHKSQVEVLENTATPMLTLITCESAMITPYRMIVTAQPLFDVEQSG